MHSSLKQMLLVGTVLGLTIAPSVLWAQKSAEKKADGKQISEAKCSKNLLKGVVNLSNNDIRFRTAEGLVVFVDPLSGPADPLAVGAGMVKPDLILITHSHGDHFMPEVISAYIGANPGVVLAGPEDVCRSAKEKRIDRMKAVAPGNEYTMAGVQFLAVPAYFTEGNSHPRTNQWVGYVLKLNGYTYYVTGDTQPIPEIAELKADVIFPLLWGCGGNVDQAVKMAEMSKASLVVPVHHSDQIEAIKQFVSRLPKGTQSLYFAEGKPTVVP
jgi:L-ascorbate metabolism protein UlaG (beta-lactamase superfamily)